MNNNGWQEHKRQVLDALQRIEGSLATLTQSLTAVQMNVASIEGRVNQASERSRIAIQKADRASGQIATIKVWVLSGVLGTLLMVGLAFGPLLVERLR